MSTEGQNGTATAVTVQTNGIKSSITSISTTSSVASVGRTIPNNSSYLYSTSSVLNRDKNRQAPPTLPKYTSSFNAGTNGNAERLARERESGGSYRLASLDRLALRQRILEGEGKPNGDTASTVRPSFFDTR